MTTISIHSCGEPYRIEAEAATVAGAVNLCRQLQREARDGFVRLAWQNGRLVADAAGPIGDEYLAPPCGVVPPSSAVTFANKTMPSRYAPTDPCSWSPSATV